MAVEFNKFYAEFCSNVKQDALTEEVNGWVRLEVNCGFTNEDGNNRYVHEWLGGSGFGAAAYGIDANHDGIYDGGEIVIAYRGMEQNSLEDRWQALETYLDNEATKDGQFADAVTFYKAVKDQYGEGNISTITGHSLGGALAHLAA